MRIKCLFSLCLALALGLFLFPSVPAEGDPEGELLYAENEWGFVEMSMDISGGIPENAEGVLARIRERGVLRVATEPYFPPQEFIDESKSGQDRFVGADMELARMLADRMGVTLVIVPLDFADVLPALADGRCDLAISALSYTPGRAASYELSKGYHYAPEGAGSGLLIRAADAETLVDLPSLEGKVLAAQSGSLQESLLAEGAPLYLEFRRFSRAQEVYDAVASGAADAGAVDVETAEDYLADHPEAGLALMPGLRFHLPLEMDGDRIAGKKGELHLMAFVNGVIDEVLSSGRYEAWFAEYQSYAPAGS